MMDVILNHVQFHLNVLLNCVKQKAEKLYSNYSGCFKQPVPNIA